MEIDQPVAPSNVKMVDLGLSVKWANMNIGATSPERRGNYYAWGEVLYKNKYSSDTYKWWDGRRLSGYCTDGDNGKVDHLTELLGIDDAATYNWGEKWRIPTYEEWYELKYNCTWDWEDEDGVMGYRVRANNGNSIFLPAAGFCDGSRLIYLGSFGYYWSASLESDGTNEHWARNIQFHSCDISLETQLRELGLSVRPVCP